MPNEVQSPEVFVDGPNQINAQRLNDHVNGAAILPGAISGKAQVTPAGGDFIMLLKGAGLGKADLTSVFDVLAPIDSGAAVGSRRTLGTTATSAAAGNDVRFSPSVNGLRKGNGAASMDSAGKPPDIAFAPPVTTLDIGTATLNCALYNRFSVTLNANTTLTLESIPNGGTIEIEIIQDGSGMHTLAFVTAGLAQIWPGGPGTVTAAAGAIDRFEMKRFGNNLHIEQKADLTA